MSQDAIVFAHSPAGLNYDLLDYHNSDDVKIFQAAVVPLDLKFDMNSATLLMFLEMVQERAEESNWKNILMIPDNYGVSQHLLTEYGRLFHENIHNFAETYILEKAAVKNRTVHKCIHVCQSHLLRLPRLDSNHSLLHTALDQKNLLKV